MKRSELLGSTVAFCPAAFCEKGYVEENAPTVRGKIKSVNKPHHIFTVEYTMGGVTYLETFNLSQIGQEVTLCGR